MSGPPAAPWLLPCPWCAFKITVAARGGPYGAGEEAADKMKAHANDAHGRTWREFLSETAPQ